jgi:RHS repeat-associated protein
MCCPMMCFRLSWTRCLLPPVLPPVNVTGAGAITQSTTYLHRLELQTYSSFGKLTHWRRPGNSTTAYTWQTRLDSVYHHRLTNQVLNNGSAAAQTTQYRTRMPLLGLDTLIAPNGLQNRFEYDAYGRLKRSRDDEDDILTEFDYIISATDNSRILQYTPRAASGTLGSDPLEVMTDVSFYDGLGRSQQVLGVKATPGGTDHLVTGAVTYDNFGRSHRQYVPFNSGGGYTTKATLPGTLHGDSKPYSEVKAYDNSPLHRPKQRLGPGNAWHSNNKYVEDRYLVAPGNTIRRYTNGISGASVTGTYPANTLLMHQTISEQGHVRIEYLDNDGKVVQKSEQDSTGTYRHTAYIYDNLDRLRFVVQPEGFETATSFTIDDAYFQKWVYEKVYDLLGRVIEIHVPGAGRSYLVYDRLDRPVMTQSALQKTLNKWSFIRYDAFGREAYTGEVTYTATQATLAGLFAGISQCYETWSGGTWSQVSFPTVVNNAPTVIKTEHIYDSNTPWSIVAPFDAAHAFHNKIDDVKGLLTGTFSYDSDDPAASYFDVVYYDYKGQVIQTIRSHHLSANPASPKKIVTSLEYNHVGDVLRTKTTWSIEGMADLTHMDSTAYDHRSRPLLYANGINGPATPACSYGYDGVGRLTLKTFRPGENFTKGGIPDYIYRPPSPSQLNTADTARLAIVLDAGTEIHVDTSPVNTYMAVIDTSAATGTTISALQTMQLKYNIRDWLTGINLDGSGNPNPSLTEGDLFSLRLDYESGGRYDGTLFKQTWTLPAEGQTPQQQRSYQYGYDASNRLKSATYTGVSGENYTVSDLKYDKNGNLKRVKRNGLKGTAYGLIDDLTYSNLGNRLMRVEDAISGNYETDFVNGNSGTDDYSYYADGCLQKDLNQDITDIDYDTYLNKPVLVTLGSGEWIRYTYDGAGSLIRRELSDGTVWDYLGSMILKDGVPYQIAMAEGRVIYEDSSWHNEYEYRDQVGNLRVAFTEREGRLQKTFQADYYPFGMAFNQKVFTPAPNKFTFHGHESTPDFGLRMTMMGARCYNQTIGRFLANDSYSSAAPNWTGYRLGWNQPMNVNDPTGNMEISDGYGSVSGAAAVDYSGPIFGRSGEFLGVDSEGYSGDIIVMDADKYNMLTNNGQTTLDHSLVMKWAEFSPHAAKLNDSGLSIEGISNVYTHIVKQLDGESFDGTTLDFGNLEGGKIQIANEVVDDDGFVVRELHGTATNPASQHAGTLRRGNGDINVTAVTRYGTNNDFGTVENIQNILGIHEYYGHGIKGLSSRSAAEHRRVYQLQSQHRTYKGVTPSVIDLIKVGLK